MKGIILPTMLPWISLEGMITNTQERALQSREESDSVEDMEHRRLMPKCSFFETFYSEVQTKSDNPYLLT